MEEHNAEECPNHFRVINLEKWQKDQNGTLGRLERKIDELGVKVQEVCADNAYRRGGEHMLKWIIGVVGFSGVAALASLIVNLAR